MSESPKYDDFNNNTNVIIDYYKWLYGKYSDFREYPDMIFYNGHKRHNKGINIMLKRINEILSNLIKK